MIEELEKLMRFDSQRLRAIELLMCMTKDELKAMLERANNELKALVQNELRCRNEPG